MRLATGAESFVALQPAFRRNIFQRNDSIPPLHAILIAESEHIKLMSLSESQGQKSNEGKQKNRSAVVCHTPTNMVMGLCWLNRRKAHFSWNLDVASDLFGFLLLIG